MIYYTTIISCFFGYYDTYKGSTPCKEHPFYYNSTQGTMILIKDRHNVIAIAIMIFFKGTMILIKDRHVPLLGWEGAGAGFSVTMILIKDRNQL